MRTATPVFGAADHVSVRQAARGASELRHPLHLSIAVRLRGNRYWAIDPAGFPAIQNVRAINLPRLTTGYAPRCLVADSVAGVIQYFWSQHHRFRRTEQIHSARWDAGNQRRSPTRAVLGAASLGDTRDDPMVFHDLRHTFGTLAVEAWPLHDVQAYMGHADIQTTMIYVHHQPKAAAAGTLSKLVAQAVSRTAENRAKLSVADASGRRALGLRRARMRVQHSSRERCGCWHQATSSSEPARRHARQPRRARERFAKPRLRPTGARGSIDGRGR